MGLGTRTIYFVFVGFASLFVLVMNLYNLPLWQSVGNQVFGTVFPTQPYLQTWTLSILLIGIAYIAAFLSIHGAKGEGASREREKWSERMSG